VGAVAAFVFFETKDNRQASPASGIGKPAADSAVARVVCGVMAEALARTIGHKKPRWDLLMSGLGQNAKYSPGAHTVCFAPDNGLKSDIASLPKSANNGHVQEAKQGSSRL
jgi:hypothetical protein